MTHVTADVTMESSTTTGTGALTLAGAITGYRTFASVMTSPSDTCFYAIAEVDANGVRTGPFEIGKGTYSAANTLTRTTVLASSNAGAAVNFGAGTRRVWIDAPANVLQNLVGNGQIAFPAAQNASADANTLDDYEEGTWTPGIAFGGAAVGVTYSSQLGLYTKIGNVVNYSGLFALSSKGSSTGSMTVTGLPFTTNSTAGYRASASPLGFDFAVTYTTSMQVDLTNSSTAMRVFKFATGNATQITDTDVANNSQMELNGCYLV